MGFPSPAADDIEMALAVNSLYCIGANSRVISTNSSFAVLDLSLKAG